MTSLNLDDNQSTYQIRSYQPGQIKVNDTIFTQSIIISPQKLIEHWSPQDISELTADAFDIIATLKPNVLLIGTGSAMALIPLSIYGELLNQGIGVEVMNTGAACRTYNALSSENRNVVAALLLK